MRQQEVIRRRNLPHWDVPGAAYFVTACLEGSIPARGLLDLARYRADLHSRERPEGVTAADWQRTLWKLEFARMERWLDIEPAVRHLSDPRLAQTVMDRLLFFAGQRYELYAFVVMPSHFHWIFQPIEVWVDSLVGEKTPRERILKSIKGYSGKLCNQQRSVTGAFWQNESFDHWIRDVDELERIIHYIENNPVVAGLVDSPEQWTFSSAYLRGQQGLHFGVPLRRTQ
jgi:type I restriction enzyme R subunit